MKKLFAVFALSVLFHSSVQAGVISQEQEGGSFQYNAHEEFGQSFTTIDSNIIFSLDFQKYNNNPSIWPQNDNLIGRLYQGEGLGGTVLDTQTINLSVTSAGPNRQWLDFDFSSINLNIGSVYTVGFTTDGTSPYGGMSWAFNNPYAGGNAYIVSSPSTNADLVFRVTGAGAVPEPSILSLFGAALLGLGLVRRRRVTA